MENAVDLTAREGGLMPPWLFVLLIVLWLFAFGAAIYRRSEWLPELPRDIAAFGALILLHALFFWRPLFTEAHVPMGGGDLSSFFFPLHAFSAQQITSGELPFWNPYLHGGMPHLANYQAGVLYPPNLIAYLLASPFSYGTLEWLALLHYLVASIGLYLLLREMGANRVGALAGAVVFAYGGFMVAHLGHYSMISVAAWLPWILWATSRLTRLPTLPGGAILAVLVYLAATGGHQQSLLFIMTGTVLWWIFITAKRNRTFPGAFRLSGASRRHPSHSIELRPALAELVDRWTIPALRFGLAVGSGLAMAMPAILPSLQLARRSVRGTLSYEQAGEFSVQPIALLQLILPTVFGSNPTDHWGAFSSGEIWGYTGVAALVLAGFGVALRPTAPRIFFAMVAVLAVFYALGPWSPLHGWTYQFVPFFDLIRAPARAYLWMNLAVAVLAGLAVSDLSTWRAHMPLRLQGMLRRMLLLLSVAIGGVALIALPLFYIQVLGVDAPENRPVIVIDNLHMLVLILGLLLVVLLVASRQFVAGTTAGILLVALVILDLFAATAPFNPTDEDLVASYREPEIATYLQDRWDDDGPFRIEVRHPGLQPNFGLPNGLHVSSGVYDPMQPAPYTALVNRLVLDSGHPAYDMLNVRFLVTAADAEPAPGFEPAFESETGNLVWERESALPRAWFVGTSITRTHAESLELLLEQDFDPREIVIVSHSADGVDSGSTGQVQIQHYDSTRVDLTVEADGPGYVLLSEGYYPGWNAEVDGDAADVVVANHGLRAIAVDSGSHELSITYRQPFGRLSVGLSLLGMLALTGMIAQPFVSRRVQRRFTNQPARNW